MNTIAHIINPFQANQESDLYTAQPITFESMRRAKEKAKEVVQVELLSAQFEEDSAVAPDYFKQTQHLNQSVLDKHHFIKKIKLPLLHDILERAYHESSADYIIYTNVDIGVYPDFYTKVNDFINAGHDAFIINRRRLPGNYKRLSDLEMIYKEKGKSHPGFDCFVFHRRLFPQFKLDGICIGVPFIEISFSQNLFALSKTFKLYDKEILTFHIGEEIFKRRAPKEYYKYNQQQFWKLVPQLLNKMSLKKMPYYHPFILWRLMRWGLHPCFPIRLLLILEKLSV